MDRENDKVPKHNKIYVSQSHGFDTATLRRQIKLLDRHATLMDERGIIHQMKEIIALGK